MDEKQAIEQLARQVQDHAWGLAQDVARGARPRESAVQLLHGYGRGVVDAAAAIYHSARTADAIGPVLDAALDSIDPGWRGRRA